MEICMVLFVTKNKTLMNTLLFMIFGLIIAMIGWEVVAFGVGMNAKGQIIVYEKTAHKIMSRLVILLIALCLITGAIGAYKLFLLLV